MTTETRDVGYQAADTRSKIAGRIIPLAEEVMAELISLGFTENSQLALVTTNPLRVRLSLAQSRSTLMIKDNTGLKSLVALALLEDDDEQRLARLKGAISRAEKAGSNIPSRDLICAQNIRDSLYTPGLSRNLNRLFIKGVSDDEPLERLPRAAQVRYALTFDYLLGINGLITGIRTADFQRSKKKTEEVSVDMVLEELKRRKGDRIFPFINEDLYEAGADFAVKYFNGIHPFSVLN